ncbi:hypothetical protein MMC34_003929 [Xylographa carneopallida]|nr:hypothetical protein [Xylographa carneopallida]
MADPAVLDGLSQKGRDMVRAQLDGWETLRYSTDLDPKDSDDSETIDEHYIARIAAEFALERKEAHDSEGLVSAQESTGEDVLQERGMIREL